MTRRYFAPELTSGDRIQSLPAEEAVHAARVMRCKVGDSMVLFDGEGYEANAVIESIGKRECIVRTEAPTSVDREPTCRSHFYVALPKPDRSKEMVERLTELGAGKLTPIVCQRTQRPPSDGLLEKLRRLVVEACKQSGRNRLMQITPVAHFDASLQAPPVKTARWFAHPGGVSLRELATEPLDSASVWIGPEGGFSDEEVAIAKGVGLSAVGLGPRIYRIETAACVIASALA